MTAPHALDDLLEEMLPAAMELSVVVRDRDPAGVAAVLDPLFTAGDWLRVKALIIDLAVMIPDDEPYADLLRWTHGPVVDDEVYAQIVSIVPAGRKRCTTCRDVLPHSEFNKDASTSDGYKTRCRDCIAEARRNARGVA